ncbi:MAG: long-chain fatty acid--CoA ligase [Euryarchaeota archaeon]|jgi:long-chain acyl-CoA synthetase
MTITLTPRNLLRNAELYADEPALSTKAGKAADGTWEWDTKTWKQFSDEVVAVSKSLVSMGFEKGDRMSIYAYNRPEWYSCYGATQMTNGVGVGVYHTCSPEEVEWVIGDSGSKVVIIGDNPQSGGDPEKTPSRRFAKILGNLPDVELVVVLDGVEPIDHEKAVSWSDFLEMGKDVEDSSVHSRIDGIEPDDLAALIYTSGTTGNPKGVMLTHDNWDAELSEVDRIITLNQGENYVSWLPLAHVFGQLVDNHLWCRSAIHMHVVDNALHVVDYAKKVQPHLFIGVPRIYEKIYSSLFSKFGSGLLKTLSGLPLIGGVLKGKAREAVGMSNVRFAVTGAAPINPDILRFFHKFGIPVYEGYGMTETTAGATLGHGKANKIGSVGKAFGGTELKLADDGEILFRGRHIMKGYFQNEEATAETMTDDGWLMSGDIGRIDEEGFVYITGRKKEIYVNSGGKNIAPLVIEETMKSIPEVSQCFLVGDQRKFCSALLTLDIGAVLRDHHGVDAQKVPKDPAEQIAELEAKGSSVEQEVENLNDLIDSKVKELNNQFAPPEQVRKFTILPRDFSVDYGELTPTLKIRRKQIRENWAEEIERMYS